MKRALIISGGWEGHHPRKISGIFKLILEEEGYEVTISPSISTLHIDFDLNDYQLFIPNWTMGQISNEVLSALLLAVKQGAGVAGIHGGMGDAFRNETEYQYMAGGQFVAHPGGQDVEYDVKIIDREHAITKEIGDFSVRSELYYMHIDPAIHVLAATAFDNVQMPVAWTKTYGKGKVFYCSIGHKPEDIQIEECYKLVKNGILWAARQ